MPLSIFFVFLVFGVGGSIGLGLAQRSSLPGWALVAAAMAGVGLYFVAAMGLPFFSVASEALVILLAAVAMVGPAAAFFRVGKGLTDAQRTAKLADLPAPRPNVLVVAPAMAGALLSFAIVLGTLTSRLNYAQWLRWSCEGAVVEKTRNKGSHNAPVVLARCGEQLERFEMVSEDFWNVAQAGQRLSKAPGSPHATLDGARLRMVPLQVGWWSDPD